MTLSVLLRSSRRLHRRMDFWWRNICRCMGLNRRSFILPLCSVDIWKLPCMINFPCSDRLPWIKGNNENVARFISTKQNCYLWNFLCAFKYCGFINNHWSKKKLNFILSHFKKLNAHQSKINDNRCIVRTTDHDFTKISFLKLVNITKFTKFMSTNLDEIKVDLCYRWFGRTYRKPLYGDLVHAVIDVTDDLQHTIQGLLEVGLAHLVMVTEP